jgi:hypothetical protein
MKIPVNNDKIYVPLQRISSIAGETQNSWFFIFETGMKKFVKWYNSSKAILYNQ